MTSPGAEYEELLARARPYLRPLADPPGDTGYGRVAVAGDEWLRARAGLYLRGLPELPLDADDMVQALIVALAELDDELEGVETRAWDPGKHPRGPDGRFRSTVDVLKERISKRRRGDRSDPFEGYDREQLRKVARARGIELKRGEDRESIAAKLLADLGGKPGRKKKTAAAGAKATPPPATPPAAPPAAPPPAASLNPAEITGNGETWWTLLPEDTGYDKPVAIRDLQVQRGYVVKSGQAFRINGTTILVEDGTVSVVTGTHSRIAREFMDVHKTLPPEADQYQRGYAWLAGRNPEDSYWARRYNTPDFQSAATAGDGGVRMWARGGSVFGPYADRDELAHEFGHNASKAMVSRGLHDKSPAWEQASVDDVGVARPTDVTWRLDMAKHMQQLNPGYAAGKGWPRGVTEYGTSSVMEDYAESVMLYLNGQLGVGRLQPGGPMKPVFFRDLFPARAKLLDQVFPEVAKRQLSAVSAR